jgi:hypothetical protein
MFRRLASLALVVAACDPDASATSPPEPAHDAGPSRDDRGANALLRHVPADTPYVMATATPLSDRTIDRIEPLIELVSDVLEHELAAPVDDQPAELASLMTSLRGRMNDRGLRELGIDPNPRWVAYGLGLAPVVRVALADGKRFTRWLADIDRADGEPELRTLDDATVWTVGDRRDELGAAIVVDGDQLVLALYPPRVETAVLAHMVGHAIPRRSLADDGWVATARSDHDLLPQLVGTVDLSRIAGLVARQGDPLAVEIADAWLADVTPDACTPAWQRALADAPRIWFGLRQLDAKAVRWAAVWELAAPLRRELVDVAAPIAGLDRTGVDDGIAALAVGIDPIAARAAAARIVARTRIGACSELDELDEELPSWLVGVHSVAIFIASWNRGLESATGTVVVGVDDPKAWLATVWPSANASALRSSGRPVALADVIAGGPTLTDNTWIAAGRHALGVARGDGERRGLRHAVRSDRDDHRTWALWSVDVPRLLEGAAPTDRARAFDWSSGPPDDLARAITAVIDRMSGQVSLTDTGLDVETGFTLRR